MLVCFGAAIFPTDPVQEKIPEDNKHRAEVRAQMYAELDVNENCE